MDIHQDTAVISKSRREFLRSALGAATLAALLTSARGQAGYPNRPVRVLLGFAAGGSSDVIGRMTSQWLSEHLGQPFVLDNRPGAASNLATELVAREAPDGYTLLWCTSANAINATLYGNLNFDFIRDFSPVAGVFRVPNVLEVHPSLPVTTVPEFIAYAKANPGKLSFASAGVGTASHMAGELFKIMTGVDLVTVHYRGDGPAMIDLMGGQVQVGFATMTASIGHIRDGKLRPLAVTATTRSPALPDLPTVADFVPG